jgi:vitamin B12 transporter
VREGSRATTLKASAGLGIKEPSFDESFGTSPFALGNADLEPERSRTFDLGVEQRLGSRVRAEAQPVPALRVAAAYTWLDSEVQVSTSDSDPVYAVGRPLLRRPEHQGSLWAEGRAGRVSGGGTLLLAGRRADSDFSSLGLDGSDGYARLDARLRVDVATRLQAFLALDNALDASYHEALGYPAPGRTVRFGVRLRTDERPW